MDDGAYIPRTIEPRLLRAVSQFPAVMVTGPRQAGKTTLVQHALAESHGYASLDAPDVRAFAVEDPRAFLAEHPPPVVLDEIQRVPALLEYIKERIDAERHAFGQWVVTGSENLVMSERVGETLAGRVAVLTVMPLTLRERHGSPAEPFPWQREPGRPADGDTALRAPTADLWAGLVRGGYPELVARPDLDRDEWMASFVQTYVERDVRAIQRVGDLTLFQDLMRMLAIRGGQLLNVADLARDLGVSSATVRAWMSVLEATYQLRMLRPYHANAGKRLVKAPKAYLSDTGLACWLARLSDPAHAARGPMASSLFETAVVNEVLSHATHVGSPGGVWFWRTRDGAEVDLLVEHEGRLVAVEAKATSTPLPRMGRGIARLRAAATGAVADTGYLVHAGDRDAPVGRGVRAVPLAGL